MCKIVDILKNSDGQLPFFVGSGTSNLIIKKNKTNPREFDN